MTAATPIVRPATPADVPAVWELVREFAAYEKLEPLLTGSPERLAADLFGASWPPLDCRVAEQGGGLIGYAMFYGVYSSFWTRPMLWLEDVFVTASHRGRGVGQALMAAVARVALERGCVRMDWAVLDWNASAIGFYERLGAARHSGWHTYRLTGEPLERLARSV